jgi:hypothetical protein
MQMKVYFIKIALRGVSPMVWRRLSIPGTASLAMLHDSIQIINGWDDFHLNQFRIFGKDYGVYHDGGVSFNDDARTVYIDDFKFDVGDKFSYEYNFFQHIIHDIRIEKIQELSLTDNRIICQSGNRMPGATKYDVMNIEHKMHKKIVSKKGKLTVNDIIDFQEEYYQVKFSKKRINASLQAISPK